MNYLIDRWLKHIDEGKLNSFFFIDLSKAFDTVVSLHKLVTFEIFKNTYDELESYLSDKNSVLVGKGNYLNPKKVSIVVP